MSIQNSLFFHGGNDPYKIVIEPWANEYEILPNETCRLVSIHPTQQADFSIELREEKYLIVYVNTVGSVYEFYRGDVRER